MSDGILLRFALAIGIMLAGVVLHRLSNRWLLGRAQNRISELLPRQPQKPVLVYFTTPTCAPCRTVQEPAIAQVSRVLGARVEVVAVNAEARPDLARNWGVMSVPTTFILDARGKARYVNNGIARADKLLKQIQAV